MLTCFTKNNYKPPPHSPNQQHILKPPSNHVHLLLTSPPSSIGKPTCKKRKNNQGKLGSKSQGDGKSDLIQNWLKANDLGFLNWKQTWFTEPANLIHYRGRWQEGVINLHFVWALNHHCHRCAAIVTGTLPSSHHLGFTSLCYRRGGLSMEMIWVQSDLPLWSRPSYPILRDELVPGLMA